MTPLAFIAHQGGTGFTHGDLANAFTVLWFAFYLLFAFWLAALFLHLGGGLTTYSLVLISSVQLVRTARARKVSKPAGLLPVE